MNIDTEIYAFIEKVQVYKNLDERPFKSVFLFGDGETPMLSFGEVFDFNLSEFDENNPSTTVAKYKDINGRMIGLNKEDYSNLTLLLAPLTDTIFQQKCDLNFLVENTFDWIIDIYSKKKADFNLTTFLANRIEEETSEYHFYFRVSALSIEQTITIGNIQITHFTKDDIFNYYTSLNNKAPEQSFKEFKKLHAPIFKSIVALVKIKGVYGLAENKSFKEVELAVNILKCFCVTYSLNPMNAIPDLDYRVVNNNTASFWSLANGNINASHLRIKRVSGIAPVRFTDELIAWANKKGLQTFSHFIKHKKTDDLYQEIVELINQYATMVSLNDNHEKAVYAISLIENVVIPASTKGKGKGAKSGEKADF